MALGGMLGSPATPLVRGALVRAQGEETTLTAQALDATDPATYEKALTEAQQILSRDDPPSIYYLQPQWSTVLRRDVQGFAFNPIYVGTFDFFGLRRGS